MTHPIHPRDASFMSAITWSEELLADLAKGWEPAFTTPDMDRAARDAMRAIAAEYPDPADYAHSLEPVFAEALLKAYPSQDRANCGHLCVPDDVVLPYLRSMGLVEFGGRCLMHFGRMVRAELMKDEK